MQGRVFRSPALLRPNGAPGLRRGGWGGQWAGSHSLPWTPGENSWWGRVCWHGPGLATPSAGCPLRHVAGVMARE